MSTSELALQASLLQYNKSIVPLQAVSICTAPFCSSFGKLKAKVCVRLAYGIYLKLGWFIDVIIHKIFIQYIISNVRDKIFHYAKCLLNRLQEIQAQGNRNVPLPFMYSPGGLTLTLMCSNCVT